MIGVSASHRHQAIIREFFELFKTPWEFAQKGKSYPVSIVAKGGDQIEGEHLTLIFDSSVLSFDRQSGRFPNPASKKVALFQGEMKLPIYHSLSTFSIESGLDFIEPRSGASIGYSSKTGQGKTLRLGYDLFDEIHHLLIKGQPISNASYPTLDRHIDLLRQWIVNSGVELLEIPPTPYGHPFTICLSHDVDHPGIRFHKGDHTLFGFLLRAIFGSVSRLVKGTLSMQNCLRSWGAALTFPLAQVGLIKDVWDTFHQYIQVEKGFPSTFFIIPFKGKPGPDGNDMEWPKRASGYGAEDIFDNLDALREAGKEIGVHGINAWRNVDSGKGEYAQIARHQSGKEVGIRMHWLYFGPESHHTLEAAGYTYDSTIGYNETVGFRSGTLQGYRPLNAVNLIEIPLHIMDTALFYPAHLNLNDTQAKERITQIFQAAMHHGGTVTVNWHDRSLAPERHWGSPYNWLIEEGEQRGAWFASMSQAAAWYRMRRSARFMKDVSRNSGDLRIACEFDTPPANSLPSLAIRTYKSSAQSQTRILSYSDQPIANATYRSSQKTTPRSIDA